MMLHSGLRGLETRSRLTKNFSRQKNLSDSGRKLVISIAEETVTRIGTQMFPAMKDGRIRYIQPFHFTSEFTIQLCTEFFSTTLRRLISTSVHRRKDFHPLPSKMAT